MQVLKGWGLGRSGKRSVEIHSSELNQPRVWSIASLMKSAGKETSNCSCPRWGQPHWANGIDPESNQASITSGTRR
jgi:hypothetical protein